jgi:hypothetical protein
MKHLLLLGVLTGFLLVGCQKEGCTDSLASNYSADAKKNDGSCQFSGGVVFWWGQNTSTQMQNNGITSISIIINGQTVASSVTNGYWPSAPDCGDNQSMTVTMNLGSYKNQSYSFQAKDQNNNTVWTGTVNINGGQCGAMELNW